MAQELETELDKQATAGSSEIPTAFGNDALVWATWLYYAEQRTQNSVAAALGVSRASVANLLSEARRRGLVQISVATDLLQTTRRALELEERFELAGAYVVPELPEAEDAEELRQRIAAAAAHALDSRLQPDMTLGVAWGRTMLALARSLPERKVKGLEIVQVSGSSLGGTEASPEACSALIAARLGARCHNFHAPAVVSSQGLRDALLAEPSLKRHFARLGACDAVLFGVGELAADTILSDPDSVPRPALDAYRAAGASGILVGRFIDAGGQEVEGPLTGRQIGMSLQDLRAIPTRICVAGGPRKTAAIRASLNGGYISHLVTDPDTAEQLLADRT